MPRNTVGVTCGAGQMDKYTDMRFGRVFSSFSQTFAFENWNLCVEKMFGVINVR